MQRSLTGICLQQHCWEICQDNPQRQAYSRDPDSVPPRGISHASSESLWGLCVCSFIHSNITPLVPKRFPIMIPRRTAWPSSLAWQEESIEIWREGCVWAGTLNACPRLVTTVNWVLQMGKLQPGGPSRSLGREPEARWTQLGTFRCSFLTRRGFLPSYLSARYSVLGKLVTPREFVVARNSDLIVPR